MAVCDRRWMYLIEDVTTELRQECGALRRTRWCASPRSAKQGGGKPCAQSIVCATKERDFEPPDIRRTYRT